MSEVKKYKSMSGYDWANPYDTCLTTDKLYTFGSYIDLCDMSIDDALAAQTNADWFKQIAWDNSNSSKPKNQLSITTVPTGSGEETEIVITSQNPLEEPVTVTMTIDGEEVTFTVTETPFSTGKKLTSKYASIENITAKSEDGKTTYTVKSEVSDGMFDITVKDEDGNTIATIPVKYGEPIDESLLPTAPEKVGHEFIGWDGITETMPESGLTITPIYEPKEYSIDVKDEDGNTIATIPVKYGEPIDESLLPTAPEKVGHEFIGWDGITETMPDGDITITPIYEPKEYSIDVKDEDGNTIATIPVKYGEPINEDALPTAPEKVGHEFVGWEGITETMPEGGITITPIYEPKEYSIDVKDEDGNTIATIPVKYGEPIDESLLPTAPEKVGHEFIGWDGITETMPEGGITITPIYEPKEYSIDVKDEDGNTIATIPVKYGEPIDEDALPTAPEKEGHEFIGWEGITETMPEGGITITPIYEPKEYTVTINDEDGNVIATITRKYGETIDENDLPVPAEKKGYEFTGWDVELPMTIPSSDISINPVYTKKSYSLTFVIDGEAQEPIILEYEADIVYPTVEEREGYTFSWDNDITVMPDEDLIINGIYTVNSYKLTFIVDDAVYSETLVDFNTPISYPDVEVEEGYKVTWNDEIPSTMPSHDLTISGIIEEDIKTFNMYYTCAFDDEIDDITADAMSSSEVEAGGAYDLIFYTPAPHPEPDVDDDDAWDAWEDSNYYSYLVLLPSNLTAVIKSDGSIVKAFKAEGTVTYDGVEYTKIYRRSVASTVKGGTAKKHTIEIN